MLVMKFGGTSVGSADAIRRVGEIVSARRKQRPVVVVSALSKVTDRLLASAHAAKVRGQPAAELVDGLRERHAEVLTELKLNAGLVDDLLDQLEEALHGVYLLRELTPRSLDYLVGFGELCSSRIVAAHLASIDVPARAWPAWEVGMITDKNHGEARPLADCDTRLKSGIEAAEAHGVPVVTGFLGQTEDGERTTLGRGGSDYTAALIGRAVQATEVQIWTDVAGIFSCDPRIVEGAYTVRSITFAEAAELAFFGAKVLHPKTIEPAAGASIPVRVLSTFEPDDPGTLVEDAPPQSARPIKGLAVKRSNLVVNLTSTRMLDAPGFLARVFGVLARHGVSVDCLATSEVSVSLTVERRYLDALSGALQELSAETKASVVEGRAVITVVGEGMKKGRLIAGRLFTKVGELGVNVEMISQGASELNLTFIVEEDAADRVLVALHDEFL